MERIQSKIWLRVHLWKEEVELEVDAHQLRDSGLHHILEVGVESEKGAVDGDHDVLRRIFVSKFFLAHLNPHLVVHLFEQSCDSSTCHHTCTSGNCLADIPGGFQMLLHRCLMNTVHRDIATFQMIYIFFVQIVLVHQILYAWRLFIWHCHHVCERMEKISSSPDKIYILYLMLQIICKIFVQDILYLIYNIYVQDILYLKYKIYLKDIWFTWARNNLRLLFRRGPFPALPSLA